MSGFEQLRRLWSAFEAEQRTFLAVLADADLARLVSYQNPPGTTWTYSLQHMLQHVVNHATYHRGQLTTMFRELGATPARSISSSISTRPPRRAADGRQVAAGSSGSSAEPGGGIAPGGTELAAARRARRARITLTRTT